MGRERVVLFDLWTANKKKGKIKTAGSEIVEVHT